MTSSHDAVGRLVVCPTPIGNLRDVTLRTLDTLREADAIACEDTRHTKGLLDRYEISSTLLSYHEHNERERAGELCERLRSGELVALVSDAGMPLLSDPGYELVQACIEAGLPVEVLPGPSSVLCALVASGLPADRWSFVGFLPRKAQALERLLVEARTTLVAFESPRRLVATLRLLGARDPNRRLAVCRELTKLYEEVKRGSAIELAEHYEKETPRGEIALVIGPPAPGENDLGQALSELRELVNSGAKARPAARTVGRLTGVSANLLYRALTEDQ